jgi:hypothetical protein
MTVKHSLRRVLEATGIALAIGAASLVAGTGPAQAAANGTTLAGAYNETLYGADNQHLLSAPGGYEARMQSDGNFVVYGSSGSIWRSNTHGTNARVVMQSDGNLVIYSDQGVLFATGTAGRGGNRLVMQSDGNLVLYGDGGAVWAGKNRSETAIQRMYDWIGRTDLEGQCEKAVEQAFSGGRYYRAIDNWNARSKQYPYSAAPRGALVFYNTSSDGHVAISLGNGQVISTSAYGKIGIVPISFFQRPLGWAWAPWQ